MPNHVTNYVYAKTEVLEALLNEEEKIDFGQVIPIPNDDDPIFTAEKHEHTLPDGEKGVSWSFDGYSPLDWAIEHWGTKWNAYEQEVNLEEGGLKFDTAWSHPFPVIEKLSKKFPEDEIIVAFADEDAGVNLGVYAIQDGEVIVAAPLIEGSEDAVAIAQSILYDDLLFEPEEPIETELGEFYYPAQFLKNIE